MLHVETPKLWTPPKGIFVPKRAMQDWGVRRGGRSRPWLEPPSPFSLNVATPKVLTFQTSAVDASDATIYTFSGKAIGTAQADRRVIVALGAGNSARTVSGVTIGGVAATIVVQNNANVTAAIVIALVTTGTTADIVVTFSAGEARCGIGVWSCTGLTSDTAVDSDSAVDTDPATLTLTTVAGGFLVSGYFSGDGSPTYTWTNATERYDATVEGTKTHSGADASTSSTSLAVTATPSGAVTDSAMVAASW